MSLFSTISGQGDVWSLTGISYASPLTDILEKENFTLEELLMEDELLQEIKSRNSSLIQFLSSNDVIEKLLYYITIPSEDESDDNRTLKFPYMSCEIFCCEIPDLLLSFIDNNYKTQHLHSLFRHVYQDKKLDNYLAGYFEKVLEVLFRTQTIVMMNYINNENQLLLGKLLGHISNYSIMQIVQRLLLPHIPFYSDAIAESLNDEERRNMQCHWSFEFKSSMLLVNRLLESTEHDSIIHIADLLITVIQLSPADAPILKHLCDSEIINKLWSELCKSKTTISVSDVFTREIAIVSVLECLLSRLHETASSLMFDSSQHESAEELLVVIKSSIQNILSGVDEVLPIFTQIFKNSVDNVSILLMNQSKQKIPIVSQVIFSYVKLVEALVRLGNEMVDSSLCSSNVISAVIDLFIFHSFHSLLHLSIQRLVLVILDDFNHRRDLCRYIFNQCQLVYKLKVHLSEASNISIARRSPLVGHLLVIAQTVNTIHKRQPSKDSSNNSADLPVTAQVELSAADKSIYQESISNLEFLEIVGSGFDVESWNEFSSSVLTNMSTASELSFELIELENVTNVPVLDNDARYLKHADEIGHDNDDDEEDDWYERTNRSNNVIGNAQQSDLKPETINHFEVEWSANFEDMSQGASSQFVTDTNYGNVFNDQNTFSNFGNWDVFEDNANFSPSNDIGKESQRLDEDSKIIDDPFLEASNIDSLLS